jgi:hypothetical protein
MVRNSQNVKLQKVSAKATIIIILLSLLITTISLAESKYNYIIILKEPFQISKSTPVSEIKAVRISIHNSYVTIKTSEDTLYIPVYNIKAIVPFDYYQENKKE